MTSSSVGFCAHAPVWWAARYVPAVPASDPAGPAPRAPAHRPTPPSLGSAAPADSVHDMASRNGATSSASQICPIMLDTAEGPSRPQTSWNESGYVSWSCEGSPQERTSVPIRSPDSTRLLAPLLMARLTAEGGAGASAGDVGLGVASVPARHGQHEETTLYDTVRAM